MGQSERYLERWLYYNSSMLLEPVHHSELAYKGELSWPGWLVWAAESPQKGTQVVPVSQFKVPPI